MKKIMLFLLYSTVCLVNASSNSGAKTRIDQFQVGSSSSSSSAAAAVAAQNAQSQVPHSGSSSAVVAANKNEEEASDKKPLGVFVLSITAEESFFYRYSDAYAVSVDLNGLGTTSKTIYHGPREGVQDHNNILRTTHLILSDHKQFIAEQKIKNEQYYAAREYQQIIGLIGSFKTPKCPPRQFWVYENSDESYTLKEALHSLYSKVALNRCRHANNQGLKRSTSHPNLSNPAAYSADAFSSSTSSSSSSASR